MALTFDATLKEMARGCPQGLSAAFDPPPTPESNSRGA